MCTARTSCPPSRRVNSKSKHYAWPLITIKSKEYFTLSLGLMLRYVGTTSTDYPHLTAGYLVASLPLIFLFIFANKFYVQGLTGSAT